MQSLARPTRFELVTSAFGGPRGIHGRSQPVYAEIGLCHILMFLDDMAEDFG